MESNIKIGDAIYVVSSDDDYLNSMGNNFERHMVQLFRALIDPNDVVADIGANIGLTAILFSSLAKKTYAFEPSPSTYNILLENLSRNNISNIEAVNVGLGQTEERLTITFSKNNRSGGYVSDKICPKMGYVTEDIRIDTLDHFFGKDIVPTFLKIDVEGYEINVIKGGDAILQSAHPTVVMEMNHFCLDVLHRITIPDFLDFMRSKFPYLYAVDYDNKTIVDLHIADQAYMVMHEHVVKHRFPNLVGGYDSAIEHKLETLAKKEIELTEFRTPALLEPNGSLSVLTKVSQLKNGSMTEIPVKITNYSREGWYGYGKYPVYISYHWQCRDGKYHIYNGFRTELSISEIAPGKVIEQHVTVAAPTQIGQFELVLTLVQEGVCWFEERGFKPDTLSIEVI